MQPAHSARPAANGARPNAQRRASNTRAPDPMRSEQDAYLATARASRSYRYDGGAEDEPKRAVGASRSAAPISGNPLHTAEARAVEHTLLAYIAEKQAALAQSKSELERSLRLNRDLEAALQQQTAAPRRPATTAPHTAQTARSTPVQQRQSQPQSQPQTPVSRPQSALSSQKKKKTPGGKIFRAEADLSTRPAAATGPLSTAQLLTALPNNKRTILDLFRNYDVNCTGAVNTAEFATGLMAAGVQLTRPQVHQLIQKLDRDNRGEIRYINLLATIEPEKLGPGSGHTARGGGATPSRAAYSFNPHAVALQPGECNSDGVPLALLAPPPLPQDPSVYVPIPPYLVDDPEVARALRTRRPQSRGLAILRTQDRQILQPDGTFLPAAAHPQMPATFTTLTAEGAPTSAGYFPRDIGFVQRPGGYELGPTAIATNPVAHRSSSVERNYASSALDPHSAAGASLRVVAERCGNNSRRFTAMMRTLDRDGDSAVTHGEFLEGLQRLGVNVPQWRLHELVRSVDRQGTGSIRVDEVGELVQQHALAALSQQAEQARQEQAPHALVNPYTTPGFVPSLQIPLHSQPVWLASEGQGSNLDRWAQARHVEAEWKRREEAAEQQQDAAQTEQKQQHRQQLQQEDEQQSDRPPPQPSQPQRAQRSRPDREVDELERQYARALQHEEDAHEQERQQEQAHPPRSAPVSRGDAEADRMADTLLAATQLKQQQQQQQQQQPTAPAPAVAHYPWAYYTTEQRETLKQQQKEQRQQQYQQQQHQSDAAPPSQAVEPFSQSGRALPVLEVEYPGRSSRSRAGLPRSRAGSLSHSRPRSRSSSISSVRSARSVRSQTPSMAGSRAGAGGGGGAGWGGERDPYGSNSSSRAGSRRGSFSQAPRPGGGVAAALSNSSSTPAAAAAGGRFVHLGDQSARSALQREREGRPRERDSESAAAAGGSARRSASQSAAPPSPARGPGGEPRGDALSQDAEFYKILRLSMAPPLSHRARTALALSAHQGPPPAHRSHRAQHDPSPSFDAASPDAFPVHHAEPSPSPTMAPVAAPVPTAAAPAPASPLPHSRVASRPATPAATVRRDSHSSSSFAHSSGAVTPQYGQSYNAWSDRRARDFNGSWTLG